MCGLIRAGLAASSSAEAPAASPPAPGSLLALGEAFPRSQLLSPAAAGCFGGGVRNAPNAPLLCRHRNEDKTMSKPCPVLLASSKKPHHPQMGPSHHHACPRPPPVAASTSVLSPTCLGPPFLFFVFFFFLPLPPSPSIPLRLCNEAHCVCKAPGPLPGSGLRFVSAFKEGKRNRCRAEPGAQPLLLPDHAAGSPTGDVWCLWHHMQAAILSQNTAITAAGWPSTAPCHPQGHENAGGAPVFPRDGPAWLQLSPSAVFAAHLRAAPASEREEERKGLPKTGPK